MNSRRSFFAAAIAFAAILSSTAAAQARGPQPHNPPHPNILFVLIDDMGYRDLSYFGGTRVKTPEIDRLAAEGVIRVPGGHPAAYLVGAAGFFVTARSIVLSCWPGGEVGSHALFFARVLGPVGVVFLAGAGCYLAGKRRIKKFGG